MEGEFNARLTKIKSSHDNLSKDEYEGRSYELPTVGHYFQLIHSGSRCLTTTTIQKVEQSHNGRVHRFWTRNSEYYLLVDPDRPLDSIGKMDAIINE